MVNKCSVKGCNMPATITVNGRPYCVVHGRFLKEGERGEIPKIHTLCIFTKDPLASFIVAVDGFRDAYLPFTYSVKVEKEEGKEEYDWVALVGAEPIDELKHDKDLVLAAAYAEQMGRVTAKELAKYLSMHPESSMYQQPNEDRARKLLDKLADLGIVKKESRAGKRGANVYDYNATERSWRKYPV